MTLYQACNKAFLIQFPLLLLLIAVTFHSPWRWVYVVGATVSLAMKCTEFALRSQH